MDKEALCLYPQTRPYTRKASGPLDAGFSRHLPTTSLAFPGTSSTTEPSHQDASDFLTSGTDWFNNDSLFSLSDNCGSLNNDTDASYFLGYPGSSRSLRNETWAIHHGGLDDVHHRIHISQLKSFVNRVRGWLQKWMDDAHCAFIHRELYADTGFPQCLQDAFATLAAYVVKTENNEEVVMQLVEDKANTLLRQREHFQQFHPADPSVISFSVPIPSIIEQLSRVQACFIYQFIRLFDGNIKQRAKAEQHIATLNGWSANLWEAASLGVSLQTMFGDGDYFAQQSQDGSMLWHNWVINESVRRTWMVANYTQSVYLALRDDQCACAGSIPFTMRRGLWEATSAATWYQLANGQDPLFMRSDPHTGLLDKISASDIDGFGLSIISIMWDSSSINSWASKSSIMDVQILSDA